MRGCVLLFCMAFFVYGQGPLKIEELGQFSYYERECINELHSDEEKLTEALKQLYMPENDPDFNAFMECAWKKDGFIDRDGNIIYDRFHFYVQGAHMDAVGIPVLAEAFAADTIEQCREVEGNTPGQTGVKLMNCILHRLYS